MGGAEPSSAAHKKKRGTHSRLSDGSDIALRFNALRYLALNLKSQNDSMGPTKGEGQTSPPGTSYKNWTTKRNQQAQKSTMIDRTWIEGKWSECLTLPIERTYSEIYRKRKTQVWPMYSYISSHRKQQPKLNHLQFLNHLLNSQYSSAIKSE